MAIYLKNKSSISTKCSWVWRRAGQHGHGVYLEPPIGSARPEARGRMCANHCTIKPVQDNACNFSSFPQHQTSALTISMAHPTVNPRPPLVGRQGMDGNSSNDHSKSTLNLRKPAE